MKRKAISLKTEIDRLDREQVGLTVALLKKQILQVAREFPRPSGLKKRHWKSVVFCGMGGSALGADVLRYLYERDITVPLSIYNQYDIPASLHKDTLTVIVSYSGTTEEPIAFMKQAYKKGVPLFAISMGGALARVALRLKIPHYVFDEKNNPSHQPRMGTGYTMTAGYLILKEHGVLKKSHEDFIGATKHMHVDPGQALQWARETYDKAFIVIAAEHLRGNAHVVSNQLNESAKTFAPFFFIPELNHHLLEGFGGLAKIRRHWTIIMLESDHYDEKIQKRFDVTARVYAKQGFAVRKIRFSGTPVQQSLKILSFGSWFTYYQAILRKLNPSTIPWVDYFKKQMAQ